MSLSVGIVGLPNVGKSTLFNALLGKQQALAANYPFATIEPNVGIVPVPDERLLKLAEVVHTKTIVPAVVEFLDIAGLVKGAATGEGLGNKFLSHIREVNLVCHVLRHFKDDNIIREGATDPVSDFETVKTELELADLEHPDASPLAKKPYLIVLNIDENDLKNVDEIEKKYRKIFFNDHDDGQVVALNAKLESELSTLSSEDAQVLMGEYGISQSGLNRLIKLAYDKLGLISFLTAGEKEVRAWTVKKGMAAPQAAAVIHTDFEKKFIKAKVTGFDDFVALGGWKGAAEKGKVRLEGRDYQIAEGDVIEYMIGS